MGTQQIYTEDQVLAIAQNAARLAVEQALSPPNLDNQIGNTAMLQTAEGDGDMAFERRRIIIAYNDDGSPIYKNLKASNQDEMNIKIVRAFIDCGRIWDYIEKPEEQKKYKTKTVLSQYALNWLERKRRVKGTTMVNYKSYVNNYIIPVLGDKNIEDISPLDVQSLLDHFSDKAKKTLSEVKACLCQIMKYAVSDDLIKKNPCDSVDIVIPSDKENIRNALPIEDFKDIISHLYDLQPDDRMFLAVYMYTAMRRGEGLGLRWEDIDFEKQEIHIRRNATYPGSNTAVITTPKTKAGTRTIPLDPALADILRPHISTGYVFGGDAPLTTTNFKSILKRINKTIDMHGATLHVLRHSYLTYAVGETTDYKTIQGISGHSDVFTLMNRYAHPQQNKVQELTEKMHKILA